MESYDVAVFSSDGTLWRAAAAGTALDYPADAPPLQPGRTYSWEVSFRGGPFGDDTAQRSFTVASAEKRRSFEETMRAIEANAPRGLADLLKAHFAIRENAYAEAERAARAFVADNPEDRVGRETLYQALELIGASEAREVLFGG